MASRVGVLSRHVLFGDDRVLGASAASATTAVDYDVAVVGAGFGGLYCIQKLRSLGFRVRCFERGQEVGGVWHWNRYPGARCDVESLQYCYAFDGDLNKEWSWPDKYSKQPDILKYLRHVADHFSLRPDIALGTSVEACEWHADRATWSLRLLADGVRSTVSARFVVMASGCLTEANWPRIPGLGTFEGKLLHTTAWPTEAPDFTAQRVGVIGTGSTGVQLIPEVAKVAGHVVVFQRTANYVIPARHRAMTPEFENPVKANYPQYHIDTRWSSILHPFSAHPQATSLPAQPLRFVQATPEQRRDALDLRWARGSLNFGRTFLECQSSADVNTAASEYVRERIRETVKDPVAAEALCPPHLMICKRLCVSDDYYAAFNRPNVSIVDLRTQNGGRIDEVTRTGIRVGSKHYELDYLVCATGFDAMTGALTAIDIQGQQGKTLKEEWASGPRTLMGLQVAGFPNMFTVTGPQSPTILVNCVAAIEQHVDWIARCLQDLRRDGKRVIEATAEAQAAWVQHNDEVAKSSLIGSSACGSAGAWYTGANVEGKPRGMLPYVGTFLEYIAKCDEAADKGYAGFTLQ